MSACDSAAFSPHHWSAGTCYYCWSYSLVSVEPFASSYSATLELSECFPSGCENRFTHNNAHAPPHAKSEPKKKKNNNNIENQQKKEKRKDFRVKIEFFLKFMAIFSFFDQVFLLFLMTSFSLFEYKFLTPVVWLNYCEADEPWAFDHRLHFPKRSSPISVFAADRVKSWPAKKKK